VAIAAGVAGVLVFTSPAQRPGAADAPPPAAESPRLAGAAPAESRAAAAPPPAQPPAENSGSSEARLPAAAARPAPAAPPPPDAAPWRQPGATAANLFPPVPQPAVPPATAAAPPRPPAFSREDFDSAGAAAASAITCGVVVPAAQDSSVSLTGVARRGEAEAAEAVFAALGIPASATRLRVEPFDAPYCDVLSQVRGIASANGAPQVALTSPDPLPGGEVLRFRVQTPGWPAHLHVAYLMTTGAVGNIFNTTSRQPPRSSVALGDPSWEVSEPYGTELLLVIASERPLFGGQRRRKVERLDQFAADLGPALSAAQEKGGRVSAQVVAVRTVPPRQSAP
jgi:serine/threonine-protein kinase